MAKLKKPANPVGRPPVTVEDLPEDWKDRMILMAADGYSEVEMRRELCLVHGPKPSTILKLWYRLKEKDVEFRETLNVCKPLIEAWWVTAGRTSINRQFFQHQMWLINMKNRFGWKDKTDVEIGITDETAEKLKLITPAEIAQRAAQLALPRTIIDTDTVPS